MSVRFKKGLIQDLTKGQLFFIECWLSLTNRINIDSDRFTYCNPLIIVDELSEAYHLGQRYKAPQKRLQISDELISTFHSDPCLSDKRFSGLPLQLLKLLTKKSKGVVDQDALEHKQELIQSLLKQLRELLVIHYRDAAVDLIRKQLIQEDKCIEQEWDAHSTLYIIINNLVSLLTSLGMPLSECYVLARNILLDENRSFNDRFEHFAKHITHSKQDVRVSLKLIGKKLYELLKKSDLPLNFHGCEFHLINHDKENVVAVNVTVKAISLSAARDAAITKLHHSLDIMASFIGEERVEIQRQYSAQGFGVTKDLRDMTLPLVNRSDRLDDKDFPVYIKTMERLYRTQSERIAKKVISTLGFLHKGLQEKQLESKFTCFWSAIESLAVDRAGDASLTHDRWVIKVALPAIILDYPCKQIFCLQAIARQIDWGPIKFDEKSVNFQSDGVAEIFESLKHRQVQKELLERLREYPYALFRIQGFINICSSSYEMGVKLQRHKEKVELQLNRIYRVRNSIVHDAFAHDRLELLIVNLEHYLRTSFKAMVLMMESVRAITSPEEAFTRLEYLSHRILEELDPSFCEKTNKKEGVRKSIEHGNVKCSDGVLIEYFNEFY